MKTHLNVIKSTSLVALLILGLGCSKKTEETGTTTDGGGTGTTLFTATDIAKTWTSGCLTGSDPITGGNRYKITLDLNGNAFSYAVAYYDSGDCFQGYALAKYYTSGTFSVGAATTGGQTISFVATASDVMPFNTNAPQAALYAACTNTLTDMASPYSTLQTPGAGFNGHHFNTYTAVCQNVTFPNSASSNKNISNVATYSNSVLTIGAPSFSIPGVFTGNAVPTSATLQLF